MNSRVAGGDSSGRGVVSLPGSPRGINSSSVPVVGSAESLVTRVMNQFVFNYTQCIYSMYIQKSAIYHQCVNYENYFHCIQVLAEQGLGAYCDAEFVRNTSREMQEALEMTQEQMDR